MRRFFGQLLDRCGPAQHDILAVLGAHEGEGLVDASITRDKGGFADKGQLADAKIIEVS